MGKECNTKYNKVITKIDQLHFINEETRELLENTKQ